MCCLTANPSAIYYIPTPGGNDLNRGQMVRSVVNGGTYFIDTNGRSILLSAPQAIVYRTTTPASYESYIVVPFPTVFRLPDPADFTGDHIPTIEMRKRLWVKKDTLWLTYGIDFTVSFPGGEQRINFVEDVYGSLIELHIHHYPIVPYESYDPDD